MLKDIYDAVAIGGGPGGTTCATLLARSGLKVLLLEKEHFPRFHIGESLLPYNRIIFKDLGVLPALEAAGFVRKAGAQFHLGNAAKGLKLVFSNGRFTRETTAFQVERSRFDKVLLDHCRKSGADVREGVTVTRFEQKADHVEVQLRGEDGILSTARCLYLIDSSGRNNLTGNQEQLRVIHPQLKKLAVFGHFENVEVDQGSAAGDTVIVRLADKWFWIIPLGSKVSVGCVLDQAEFATAGRTAAETFYAITEGSTEMRRRMQAARLLGSIQATTDFSYHNRRLVGTRLLRVGDAAGFIDPIFSAGVYLAMHSGRLAASTVLNILNRRKGAPGQLAAYEKRVFRAMRYFGVMVEKFYTRPFMELFMEPRPKFDLPDAIVAILAGELEGGLKLEVRRQIFFGLVKLQQRWPLVPRLSFDEPSGPEAACAALKSA